MKKNKAIAALSVILTLWGCGDDSGSNANEKLVAVPSIYNLGDCTKEFEGDTVFVKEEKADYVCLKGKWTNINFSDDSLSSSSEFILNNDPESGHSSSSIMSSDSHEESGDSNSSSSFAYEQNSSAYVQPEVLLIKDKAISGVSQKGPFITGSAIKLYELNGKTFAQTGRSFTGKITSDSGTFSIPKITLESQYALLEANGYFRNEFTGNNSSSTITLNAFTDLSSREKVNINLLTHLEYERALYLVNTGINVPSAKKQAEAEILNAFGIRGDFVNSEDLDIFSKGDGNAALLAFSVLMLGDLSEADLTERLTNFATDIEKDGSWNDEVTKAKIADWAAIQDLTDGFMAYAYERLPYHDGWGDEYRAYFYISDPNVYLRIGQNTIYKVVDQSSRALTKIRSNIEGWNLGIVPDFEKYIRNFWYSVYGLGDCDAKSNTAILATANEHSLTYGTQTRFICRDGVWLVATDMEKDTYQWANGTTGEIKKGNVTDTYYTFDGSKWIVADRETVLGLCTKEKNGTVEKYNASYYICKAKSWTTATVVEYDTYQFGVGQDGEVRIGRVNKSNHYVYENGTWRASASEVEDNLGACVESRNGEKRWLECDNYSSSSTCYYAHWYGASQGFSGVKHYICEFPEWKVVTPKEYQTYGIMCTQEGTIVNVSDDIYNTYFVCDADTIRYANYQEINFNKGCVSYILGDSYVPTGQLSYYKCEKTGEWLFDREKNLGTMTDSRDGKEYRTTTVGTQIWMAENLDYAYTAPTKGNGLDSSSFCYQNNPANCDTYGRLYLWSAAMDSAGVIPENAANSCGKGVECSPAYPVRGVCPNGWHLPSKAEFETLFSTIGGKTQANKMLKSTNGWISDGNGEDAFGFNALPAGKRGADGIFYHDGDYTKFWNSTEYDNGKAYGMSLNYNYDYADLEGNNYKNNGFSVRCIKD